MSERQRYQHEPMRALAWKVIQAMADCCVQATIAGSLRRGEPTVGDIELVVQPRLTQRTVDLFGTTEEIAPLDQRIEEWRAEGRIRLRLDRLGREAWGPRYRRALVNGMPLDLFICREPAQYGVLLAIRTGPSAWSKRLVTQRRFGGLLPDFWSVHDGGIYDESGQLRPTPTEEDVFALLGIDWIEPRDRR